MILTRVISGMQSGADLGGIRAARDAGLITGGWMPAGFKTEDGCQPHYAELYGASEHSSPDYPPRTALNVIDSNGTIWFGDQKSRGGILTFSLCEKYDRPTFAVDWPHCEYDTPEIAAAWIVGTHPEGMGEPKRVINIAGNRESKSPGIEAWVYEYMTEVFRVLKERR